MITLQSKADQFSFIQINITYISIYKQNFVNKNILCNVISFRTVYTSATIHFTNSEARRTCVRLCSFRPKWK